MSLSSLVTVVRDTMYNFSNGKVFCQVGTGMNNVNMKSEASDFHQSILGATNVNYRLPFLS